MEAESVELEDGEVLDDEHLDVFDTYNVLERPHNVLKTEAPVVMVYSDESDESPNSESDSDSDSAKVKIKKPKIKIRRCKTKSQITKTKNEKYKVWCKQVQEESLSEDLISCGVTKSFYQERSVESYNYTARHNQISDPPLGNTSDEEKETGARFTNKRTFADRCNVKLRLERRIKQLGLGKNSDGEEQKGSVRVILDLSTTGDSPDADVATDIATKLGEKKDDLIRRVVSIIGKQKAINFFQKTKKIEEDGGMMIMNGSRRRTAGGVYFWLLKNDRHIPQEKIREIFMQDKKEHMDHRRKMNSMITTEKVQSIRRQLESQSDKDLPALLTRAELSTRQIAEEARLRRGEGMDRIPLDSDRTVSNPPPSPVTDDPDHAEHPVHERRIQNYDDDILDIGLDADSMEFF